MDSSCEMVEIPIEAAQEYIAMAVGFAPLHLSDLIYNIFTDTLCELVEKVVGRLHVKYELCLTQDKVDALKKMIKIKLQGQQNLLFDQFDNFIICEVFSIGDDVVLPDDIPQTTYSRKKHDWIKKSIGKYEKNLMLLNLAKKRINEELADVKVLHEDLKKASTIIGDAIKSNFGGASVEEFRLSVDALIRGRENIVKSLKLSGPLP